jgi:adenylate cyclase
MWNGMTWLSLRGDLRFAGARLMVAGLETLNAELAMELTAPLRMGIGIHFGDAIVGTMGPPGARIVR